MISILFTIFLYSFSVPVTECTELQKETTYIYNYDNFGDIFQQGDMDDFNLYKYEDIHTGYEGPHVGGAFTMQGVSIVTTNYFHGYLTKITANFYCGNPGKIYSMLFAVYYLDRQWNSEWICGANLTEESGWHYNYTWIPPTRFNHSEVSILFMYAEECT